ncbi:MAG: methyltransferase domain-containing protein [Verrucomicrobiota bacterium]|jgi:2-polyprenyl-3-methyl-5-hydroxy-6-metoxy-1,4-benzoquinol methylase|nr:methyltransferase domain-containing protein [Verrucomicrobiota bacterium]
MKNELYQQHLKAAEASGGTSAGPIYELVRRLCLKHRVQGSLLDFGAGTGNLLKLLLSSDLPIEATGADILGRNASLPPEIRWVEGDLNQPLPVSGGLYDVVVSSEVIEHLENPRASFRDLNRVLKPGGLLILTTPNQESFRSIMALILTGHFMAFMDPSYPAHITALLRKDFVRICQETGFEPPAFAYSDHGGLPKAGHIAWQSVSFGLLKGRWFSDNLALVTRKTQI